MITPMHHYNKAITVWCDLVTDTGPYISVIYKDIMHIYTTSTTAIIRHIFMLYTRISIILLLLLLLVLWYFRGFFDSHLIVLNCLTF